MKVEAKKVVVLILIIVAMAAYFLRKAGLLYIPGLTPGALTIGMGMLAADMLAHREEKKNKIMGILMAAFALLMAFTCGVEIIGYING